MCIIAYLKHNNNIYLIKNRDRIYRARIKIIHELINGIEIVYIKDIDSGWIEGMNEYGISLVNSALLVKYDEAETTGHSKGSDGKKIKNALINKSLKKAIISTLTYSGYSKMPLKGHTIIANPNHIVHIESTSKDSPQINVIRNNNCIVLSNHGITTKSGYRIGRKKISSILRKLISEHELKNITNENNILDALNKTYYDLDPRFTPYRNREHTLKYICKPKNSDIKIFSTSTQIMMNLTTKEFTIRMDKNNSEYYGYINKLPLNYTAKIKININFITRNNNLYKTPIDNIIINYIIKK